MSTLIHDMEMPTSCGKCRFCVNGFTDDAPMYECAVQSYENVSVLVESGGKPFDFRPDWCPLIEVKLPHGELIDKTEILEYLITCLQNGRPRSDLYSINEIVDYIEKMDVIVKAEEKVY